MIIYTSYFANIKNISKDLALISISAKAPVIPALIEYKALAPSYNCLMKYKQTKNQDEFITTYYREVLAKANPIAIYAKLTQLSKGKNGVVLLCYEKSSDFCHRHIIAEWLRDELKIDIVEWANADVMEWHTQRI